jgi:hypothetical protein
MRNDYEKYMEEISYIKNKAYNDYKKSGFKNYVEYIKNELKNEKINFRKKPAA